MFTKLLVANRGEIAVRIIRACKEMGIRTVAVYSKADAESIHVALADEAVCIGEAAAKDSYLNQERIISAALVTKAQAIHPGYGFLAENAAFADLCKKYGIAFVGPSGELISRMGDKDAARRLMQSAGVPTIPGTEILENAEAAKAAAKTIGYPVMLKASAGGGGKGIRLVKSEEELAQAFETASAEADQAFGDGRMYMEKYIYPAKHIEVQLLCDEQGHVVCLGERECSIQRNNQKLIEESPSPGVSEEKRRELFSAAAKAAKAVGYVNAGTVEFLMDRDKNFYFMEMNTRLQVEHPVSELVTGTDIVKWQIRIAAGVEMNFTQDDIKVSGAAIECRINAGGVGKVDILHIPSGPWVRFD
ncbi:MAG: ATP-grasp domain-containing protein, partial [Clostridia bacterium]|nr:ATP-grasp domain-containing protein [Clostridia bacterium]